MFFIREKSRITLFGVDKDSICNTPELENEDYDIISSNEQSNQSSKLKELNIDKEGKEKYAQIESKLNKTSKMLADYGKQPQPAEPEEQKDVSKSPSEDNDNDELGQINELETESGGNIDRNPTKPEEAIPLNVPTAEENKQEE